MSQDTSTDTTESTESTAVQPSDEVPLTVTPTIRPILVRLVLVVATTVVLIGVLFTNPELLGSVDATNIGLLVVQLLAVVLIGRLIIEILILRQTEYVITHESVTRTYDLLRRSNERQVPLDRIRSHELDQSRTESILDHGTITLNRGLGTLRLRNIPDPHDVHAVIREQTVSQ